MNKARALNMFWSQFELDAFEENSLPTEASKRPNFPYITYFVATDSFGNEISLSGSLWYRERSWLNCEEKTQEIADKIGRGGLFISLENNEKVWIKKGTPFAQSMGDDSDELIKRKLINITAEFFTAD